MSQVHSVTHVPVRSGTLPGAPALRDALRNASGRAVSNPAEDLNTHASIDSVSVPGIVWLCRIVCLDAGDDGGGCAGAGW